MSDKPVFEATFRVVGRVMGLERTMVYRSDTLETARADAERYLENNRREVSKVLRVKERGQS